MPWNAFKSRTNPAAPKAQGNYWKQILNIFVWAPAVFLLFYLAFIFMIIPVSLLLDQIHPGWGDWGWLLTIILALSGVFVGLVLEWSCESQKKRGVHERTCGNSMRRTLKLFLIGLVPSFIYIFILMAIMANPSQKPFDSQLWQQEAKVTCGGMDERKHMREAVLAWLNDTRPDRDAVLDRLGSPLVDGDKHMVYMVGGHIVTCMTLEIDFDENNRVTKAQTYAD